MILDVYAVLVLLAHAAIIVLMILGGHGIIISWVDKYALLVFLLFCAVFAIMILAALIIDKTIEDKVFWVAAIVAFHTLAPVICYFLKVRRNWKR